MLMDMIGDIYPASSYTEIENLLKRAHPTDEDRKKREAIVYEYLIYVIDVLSSVILNTNESIKTKNIFVS